MPTCYDDWIDDVANGPEEEVGVFPYAKTIVVIVFFMMALCAYVYLGSNLYTGR